MVFGNSTSHLEQVRQGSFGWASCAMRWLRPSRRIQSEILGWWIIVVVGVGSTVGVT
jgi:hypothetical protein